MEITIITDGPTMFYLTEKKMALEHRELTVNFDPGNEIIVKGRDWGTLALDRRTLRSSLVFPFLAASQRSKRKRPCTQFLLWSWEGKGPSRWLPLSPLRRWISEHSTWPLLGYAVPRWGQEDLQGLFHSQKSSLRCFAQLTNSYQPHKGELDRCP